VYFPLKTVVKVKKHYQ